MYGGKFAEYIDIKNEVIMSPDHFVSLYLEGFKRVASEARPHSAHRQNFDILLNSKAVQEYLFKFLQRVYLRNYTSLNKKRPMDEEAVLWIGQTNANYGLLVTPIYNDFKKQWTNDHSEIRHVDFKYWSIGHILHTGLVIPDKKKKIEFPNLDSYLTFFTETLVRNSGSNYEMALAEKYCEYVREQDKPEDVPLLIPELRYDGLAKAHKYRLDFTIIESAELTKVGFEVSPWSTHGYLSKIGNLTQAQINNMAKDNFQKEMKKHKEFFRRYGIFTMIYTDDDLADLDTVFADMKKYLRPKTGGKQLQFHIIHEILGF